MATKTIAIKCKGAAELSITQLTPLQGAFKVLTEDNARRLRKELTEDGFIEPISVWEDSTTAKIYILNGHQRYIVLMDLRANGYVIPQIPVNFIEATDLNDAKRKILALASQYGSVSTTGLSGLLSELGLTSEVAQEFLNFPEVDLAAMMSGLSVPIIIGQEFETNPIIAERDVFTLEREPKAERPEEDDEDELPDVREPRVKANQIWQLGDHRLMCANATSKAAVDRLLDGAVPDMIYTDPPYGIDEETDRSFAAPSRKAKGNSFAKIIGDKSIDTAVNAWAICDSLAKTIVYWGGNYYAHKLPPSACWAVWDKRVEENQRDLNSDCELAYVKHPQKKSVRIFRHLWKGMIKGSENGQRRVHPTQKPVALAEWAFGEFGPECKTILDLFGGSGSTLIACEKTNRKCFAMELDAHYCSVIIDRWEAFTGKKATLLEND